MLAQAVGEGVLDEINYAIGYGMIDPAKVVETLKQKPEMAHVILTGRNAGNSRHCHRDAAGEARLRKGVVAQRGIEY